MFDVAYYPGDPAARAAYASVSHGGLGHLIRNVLVGGAAVYVLHRYASIEEAVVLFAISAPTAVYAASNVFDIPIIGASLGTFTLLGFALGVVTVRRPDILWATPVILVGTVVLGSDPWAIVLHILVFGVGLLLAGVRAFAGGPVAGGEVGG